jgi:hypothetical protein
MEHWCNILYPVDIILSFLVAPPLAEAPEMNEAGVYALQSESPLIYLAMEEQAEIDAVFEQNAKLTFISTNDGALIRQLQLPVPKGAEIASFSAARPTSGAIGCIWLSTW